jgi:hypothetical protein
MEKGFKVKKSNKNIKTTITINDQYFEELFADEEECELKMGLDKHDPFCSHSSELISFLRKKAEEKELAVKKNDAKIFLKQF